MSTKSEPILGNDRLLHVLIIVVALFIPVPLYFALNSSSSHEQVRAECVLRGGVLVYGADSIAVCINSNAIISLEAAAPSRHNRP
jgi:hypothetical protein